MKKKYLVTGGAGFIGSHLVEALLRLGHHVVALDNLSTGRLRNLDHLSRYPEFRFVQGSVLDELAVDELMHSCDSVVHLAAAVGVKLIVEEPLRSFTTNIRGSEIVIESAFRHRRPILLASTSEIYGKNSEYRCARTTTASSDRRRPPAGPTAPPRPSTRSWPTRTTGSVASRRPWSGSSTPSAPARAPRTGWSSPDWPAKPSPASR